MVLLDAPILVELLHQTEPKSLICLGGIRNAQTQYGRQRRPYVVFKYNPTEENYVNFKRLQAVKKLTLNRERRNSWMNLCSSFSRLTPLSLIWKYMRKFNRTFTPSSNYTSWINDFLCKYSPDFVNKPFDSSSVNNSSSINNSFLKPFTLQELKSAIATRRDTSFGLDGIPYIVFKKMNDSCLTVFLKVLNGLWSNNHIPDDWKTDCLVPILNSGKPRAYANSYRPIALTSCVGKIFEQLLKQRLEFYVEQNGLLPSNQFGFGRGRSARESVCQLQLDIQNSLANNKALVAVFFDIAGAFNSVNLDVLCSELLTIGLPEKFVNWIHNFLSERKVYVKYNNGLFGPRNCSVGTCQGGILSPLIFILYTYTLP